MTCAFCVDTGLMSTIFANKIRKFLPMRKVADLNIFSPNCACSCPGFAVNNLGFFESGVQPSAQNKVPLQMPGARRQWARVLCATHLCFFGLGCVVRKLGGLGKNPKF